MRGKVFAVKGRLETARDDDSGLGSLAVERAAVDAVQYVLRRVKNCRRGDVSLRFDVRNRFIIAPVNLTEDGALLNGE